MISSTDGLPSRSDVDDEIPSRFARIESLIIPLEISSRGADLHGLCFVYFLFLAVP
jgi:hypothetical protein